MPDYQERLKADDPRWLKKTITFALPRGSVMRDSPKSTGIAIAALRVGDQVEIIDVMPHAIYLAVKANGKIGWVSRHTVRFTETGMLPPFSSMSPSSDADTTEIFHTVELDTQPFRKTTSAAKSPSNNDENAEVAEKLLQLADKLRVAAEYIHEAQQSIRNLTENLAQSPDESSTPDKEGNGDSGASV
jgi:hypothetical protein